MRRSRIHSPNVPNPCRGSSVGQSGGLIIRRSGVRVPTPVLTNRPELSRQVPPGTTSCDETTGESVFRPNPSMHGPVRPLRATRGATRSCQDDVTTDLDLAAVVEAWPELPEALRAGILAMVKAARS